MNDMTAKPVILDEEAVREIEGIPFYSGYYEAQYLSEKRDALCQTVRVLRAENSTLKGHWADTSEDLASALLKQEELAARLKEVEQENDRLKAKAIRLSTQHESLIADLPKTHALKHAEGASDFRTRVHNLCREKAAEWGKDSDEALATDFDSAMSFTHMVRAVNELREAIENLGIETTEKEEVDAKV